MEDRSAVDALYARVFGSDAAAAYRSRWEWLYARNPNLRDGAPLIWLAREGEMIVGQYATMPVKLSVNGQEIDAAWGMDVMIAPEGQRKGLGRILFETWDGNVGAAIGLSLTDASNALFEKMNWPLIGRVPRLAKPLSPAVLDDWGGPDRLRGKLVLQWRRLMATLVAPRRVREITHFDDSFTRLWERVAPRFAFAARRDATYLNWKYLQTPHVKYSVAALMRNADAAGYVVIRHVQEPRWKVTLLVDFLADPADTNALTTLLRWVDRQALRAGSDVVRVLTTNAAFGATLRASGYRAGKATMRFVAKINAVPVAPSYYQSTDRWHITLGDSDADR